jgi:small subunit ribosomal protein S8
MLTDPVADMLTRIRNAQQARKPELRIPASRLKKSILEVLASKNFIKSVREEGEKISKVLVVELDREKAVSLRKISKPGQRIYKAKADLKPVLNGLGIAVLSTSQGIMTNSEAYKKGIGGEVICEIY